jgi:hypothetical protein
MKEKKRGIRELPVRTNITPVRQLRMTSNSSLTYMLSQIVSAECLLKNLRCTMQAERKSSKPLYL